MDWQKLNKQKHVGNQYINAHHKAVGHLRLAQ